MNTNRLAATLLILLFLWLLAAGCRRRPEETAVLPPTAVASPRPTRASTPIATATTIEPTAVPQPPAATPKPAGPPQVSRRVPGFTQLTSLHPEIRLVFSQPMDLVSVSAALTVEPPLPLQLAWDNDDLIIRPSPGLLPDHTYLFVLQGTATNRQGIAMGQDYAWTYRTNKLIGTVAYPTDRNANAPITIRFNYPVDESSIEDSLAFDPPLPGLFSWHENGARLTYHPLAPYRPETSYTLRFTSEIRDVTGQPLPPPAAVTFQTPPPILLSAPQGQSVNPLTAVRVTFDRPVDQEKTAAAFTIIPVVSGYIEWEETTLIFRPDSGHLAPNTSYTVAVNTSAVDADGEPLLRQSHAWTFRTGQLEPVATFGWGPNAQVLDADGRRAVHFNLLTRRERVDVNLVTFELYNLSLPLFLDRYSSGFRGVAGWERQEIPLDGAEFALRWEMSPGPSSHEWANIQEVIIPEEAPPGLYILNLVAGELNDQLILLLTRNSLMVKEAEGQLVAWLTNINGGPVADAEISVYARDGRLLQRGQSDANGLYRTRVTQEPQPLIVIARDGRDLTASGLSNEWRQGANPWGGWWGDAPTAKKMAAHIYTDRPIYRPGQTVYFKAIVRHDNDALLTLPAAGTAVTARIRDARNNVVQTLTLNSNHFGAVSGEFQVAEGAGLGEYAVEIVLNNESQRQIFKVEDYRKPDYQVTVSTSADRFVAGETIAVTVDSQYYFGEPVPDAAVTITFYNLAERYGWDEGNDPYIWYRSQHRPISGRTDSNGRFTFEHPAEQDDFYSGNQWQSNLRQAILAIEATIDDGSHQTVSGVRIVRIYNAAERISLDTAGYIHTPGEPFTIRAGVHDIFDRPVNGRQLSLRLLRYNTRTNRYDQVIQSATLTTGNDGRASLSFTINEPGYYQVEVTGRDRDGQEISFTSWLYGFSRATFFGSWHGRASGALTIVADQSSYSAGETARLAIESQFSGPALLTFERGSTRREQLIELTAPLTLLDVPILPEDVPNIFITVNAWREQDSRLEQYSYQSIPDSRLHTATLNLPVPASDKVLTVTITPNQEVYGPRQEATFTLRVTNYQGDPVSAELSLAVVDEAIFALSRELSGPIYDGFYYARANVVRTYHSMAPVRDLGGGGMGGGGNGGLDGNPRSDFPDTARWFPTLHTDANGEVVVTMTLPDSLTSWRLTAKAATADTQVGETFTNITTRQDVIVRPILPRALTAGDQAQVSALVHNYSGQRQTLAVSLAVVGDLLLAVDGPLTQTVTLNAGEVRVVGWPVTVVSAGEAQLLVRVVAGEEVLDAVQLPLWLRPLAVPDVTTEVGQFSGTLNTTLDWPAGALAMSSARIELSRSIAGTLLEGLDYLTGFPYGCVEQTMSRALPNAVVARAFHQMGMGNATLQADLTPKINAGLQRLYGFQHTDGGWGWWFDDRTDVYQTAWVLFGLAVTADAGYEVEPAVIERGAVWLKANLPTGNTPLRAYALYSLAMAGHGDLPATHALAQRAEQMDDFSQAALALALYELGAHSQARQMVDVLAEAAVVGADGRVHWSGANRDGQYDNKIMASDTRSTAIALSAFSRIRPNHELVPGVARWLMGARRQQGWGTTNETAFAIIGLTDHLLATSFSEAATATNYSVILNGEIIASGSLGRGEPAVSLEIPAEAMRPGANDLRIQQSGSGRLYYTINNRVYLAQEQIAAAGAVTVERSYLDPQTNRPVTQVEPGQLVRVQLVVTLPDAANFMIVEDNLPGGLEALNESLNTTSRAATVYETPRFYWQELGYNYKEVRAERVSFFITEMGRGRHTFSYLARATHAGHFTALPAEAWAMYDLTIWGRSASDTLRVGEPPGPATAAR